MTQADNEDKYNEILRNLREAKEKEEALELEKREWETRLKETKASYRDIINTASETTHNENRRINADKWNCRQDEERNRLIDSLKNVYRISKKVDELESSLQEIDRKLIECIRKSESSIKERMSVIFDKDGII